MNYRLQLQYFAEGAAGAGTAGTAAEGTGEGSQQAAAANTRAKNDLSNVRYGKQTDNQPDAPAEQNNASERITFEELIKGDYKDDYQKSFQKAFNERFKQQKQAEEALKQQMEALNPLMDMLASKYGIDAKDTEALMKAIDTDDAYYEQEAASKGMSVEQLKASKKMEAENIRLRQQMQERMQDEQIQKNMQEWYRQGEELKSTYPNFDFKTESQNKDFRDLIMRGIPVKTAYETIHLDEIMSGAMQYTAQKVAQQVSQNIQTRAQRPAENGASSNNAGIVTKTDVSKLTKQDRQEIIRRVQRGENISF